MKTQKDKLVNKITKDFFCYFTHDWLPEPNDRIGKPKEVKKWVEHIVSIIKIKKGDGKMKKIYKKLDNIWGVLCNIQTLLECIIQSLYNIENKE